MRYRNGKQILLGDTVAIDTLFYTVRTFNYSKQQVVVSRPRDVRSVDPTVLDFVERKKCAK